MRVKGVLLQGIGLALALCWLAACGAPAPTPTSWPATASPLPPTATPVSSPRETAPTPTPSGGLPDGCPPQCAGATLFRVELPGIDLHEADLSGAYLRLADLRGADLAGATLRMAQLDGANLAGANLREASLRGAQLRPALPDQAPCPGLEPGSAGEALACPARLGGADLHGADLSDADLSQADLAEADLGDADLRGANLSGANLQAADLRQADLRDADLRRADLSGADLRQADLWSADLRGAEVSDEQLAQALQRRDGIRPGQAMNCTVYHPTRTDGPIWTLVVAPDRQVWASAFRGLSRFDLRTGTWTPLASEEDRTMDRVRSIAFEPGGAAWLTLPDGQGVARYDGAIWARTTTEQGLISDDVLGVSVAPDGSVWFSTEQGVSHWDPEAETWTSYTEDDGLYLDEVWDVLFTPDGRIWFVHMGALSYLAPAPSEEEEDEWGHLTGIRFLASKEAIVDAEGRLWVALAVYDPQEQAWIDTVYREFQAQALAVDGKGGMWIGRKDGAIYIPNPLTSPEEDWLRYGAAEGLPDDDVLAIDLERDDIVWFGTRLGATRCVVPLDAIQRPAARPTLWP
jgi:uncharacterized protein YjbI with pentapeptide repeats/frataxin-like iron-binding protein CyaY